MLIITSHPGVECGRWSSVLLLGGSHGIDATILPFFFLELMIVSSTLCARKQKFLVRNFLYQWVWPNVVNRIRPPHQPYQKIEVELKSKPDWPKLGGVDITKSTNV